jgi:hypothetical protein
VDPAFRAGGAPGPEGPAPPTAAKSATGSTQMVEADSAIAPSPSQLGQPEAGGMPAQSISSGSGPQCSDGQQLPQTDGTESADQPARDSSWPSFETIQAYCRPAGQSCVDGRFQGLVSHPRWLPCRTIDCTGSFQSLSVEHSPAQGPELEAGPPRISPGLWAIRLPESDPCRQRQSLWIHRPCGTFAVECLVDGAGDSSRIYRAGPSRTKWRARADASGVEGRNDTPSIARSAIATATNGSVDSNLQSCTTPRRAGTAATYGGISLAERGSTSGSGTVSGSLDRAAGQEQWADQMEGPQAIRRRSIRWLQRGTQEGARRQSQGVLCGNIDRRTLGARPWRNASGGLCASGWWQISQGQPGYGALWHHRPRPAFWCLLATARYARLRYVNTKTLPSTLPSMNIAFQCVTHVFARFVTHVFARCREGESFGRQCSAPRVPRRVMASGATTASSSPIL